MSFLNKPTGTTGVQKSDGVAFNQERRKLLFDISKILGTTLFLSAASHTLVRAATSLFTAQQCDLPKEREVVNKEFKQGETVFKFSWGSVEMRGVGTSGKFNGTTQVGLAAKNLKGKQVGKQVEVTEGKPVTLFIQSDGVFINTAGTAAEGFSCLISGQPFGKEADLVNGTLYTISCSEGNPAGQTATLKVTSQSK